MNGSGALDGKVIVITGAGRGLGREMALLAATEGANIVVNDFGAGPHGEGGEYAAPVQEVATTIKAAGGAVAVSTDNVADPVAAGRIIETALDAFGRLDAVINNAGIVRDRIFHQMSLAEWQQVIDVHLMGSFHVARAAANHFRRAESGSFVHLVSTSGLIGNIGQANYAAAKMGIVGLSRSIALDMARFNVRSNCLSPFAWSRLAATVPTGTAGAKTALDRIRQSRPEKVAPLALFLASDLARGISGQIFAIRQNEVFLMSQPRPVRSVHRSEGWTVATLASHMAPAMQSTLTPLEQAEDVFNWDPI